MFELFFSLLNFGKMWQVVDFGQVRNRIPPAFGFKLILLSLESIPIYDDLLGLIFMKTA